MNVKLKKPGGIYVHIPFCVKKCRYCDFYSITDFSLKFRYLQALMKEVQMVPSAPLVFDTLYFGGGTPSVFTPEEIGQIVEATFKQFDIAPDAEVTLEVNPGTVTYKQFNGYLKGGINRLNIGAQSFQDANLQFLGRIHTSRDSIQAFDWSRRAGFENVGLDLIYGLPEQTKENWRIDMQRALKLNPDHLSCYMLTCEPGTPLHRDLHAGRYQPLPDGKARELFNLTAEFLENNGYVQYETSNFARKFKADTTRYISRHNFKYWTFAPYLGFGASAHSFIEPQRHWNLSDVKRYIQEIEAGQLPVEETEVLTGEQLIMEAIYLGLRTFNGIDVKSFHQNFGLDFLKIFKETITDLEKEGMLRTEQSRIMLSRKGMSYLDSITSMFTSREIEP
jgi:oxygen-independent coproporphyrinogen-3 oxidase